MEQTKKIYIAISLFSILCLWLGQKIGDRQGLLTTFFLILIFNTYIYYFSDKRILYHFKKKELEGSDPWGILDAVNDLAKKAYIPVPHIYLSPLASPTSLTVARTQDSSAILLSENIVDYFDKEELKAILALQIAKIKRMDTLPQGMFSNLMSIMLKISYSLDYLLFFQWIFKKEKRWMPTSFLFLQFIRILYKICMPDKTYFATDKLAAELYPNPKKIAHVLWKLESYATTSPMNVPLDMAHIFIVNPLPKQKLYSLLRYQPNYDKRIQKLVGYFPI